jgi:hypothetical protein
MHVYVFLSFAFIRSVLCQRKIKIEDLTIFAIVGFNLVFL